MSGSTGKSDKNKSMMFYISSPVIKLACAIVCVFVLWFFFMPIKLGITNIGNVFGIFIASVLLIYFVLNKPVCKLITQICTNRFGKAVIFLFVGFLCKSPSYIYSFHHINKGDYHGEHIQQNDPYWPPRT